jgi:hypothetical protein
MAAPSSAVAHQRARAARLTQSYPPDHPKIAEAKRDLNAANLEAAVLKALRKAPRPSDEQLQRIASLLLAGASTSPPPPDRKAVIADRIAELGGGGSDAA